MRLLSERRLPLFQLRVLQCETLSQIRILSFALRSLARGSLEIDRSDSDSPRSGDHRTVGLGLVGLRLVGPEPKSVGFLFASGLTKGFRRFDPQEIEFLLSRLEIHQRAECRWSRLVVLWLLARPPLLHLRRTRFATEGQLSGSLLGRLRRRSTGECRLLRADCLLTDLR